MLIKANERNKKSTTRRGSALDHLGYSPAHDSPTTESFWVLRLEPQKLEREKWIDDEKDNG